MTTNVRLSKLERVDLRDVWQNEATGFTKWLARDENLGTLGEAIDMDLELIETESAVGAYRADIYARTGDGRLAVIENQLMKSNHDHLGKLITYASGKDAHVAIWIVSEADEEHSQAVEWLNAHTDGDIGFFLIEIELWRIDGSASAPKFNVVERPNDWGKVMKGYSDLTETQQIDLDYWQAFHDRASADEDFMRVLKPQGPLAQSWSVLSIGSSHYRIQLTVNTQREGSISCGIYFDNDQELFEKTKAAKDVFSEAVGAKPELSDPNNHEKSSFIRFFKKGCNVKTHPELWNEYIDWQMRSALALKHAFDELR